MKTSLNDGTLNRASGGEGLFSGIMSSIFGNGASDLTNEPTIDYNQTIHSIPSFLDDRRPLHSESFVGDSTTSYALPRRYNQSAESTINTREYSQPFAYRAPPQHAQSSSYSRDKVAPRRERSYNDLFDNIGKEDTFQRDSLSRRPVSLDRLSNDYTGSSLPYDYPGKFLDDKRSSDFTSDDINRKIADLEKELSRETQQNTNYNKNILARDSRIPHKYSKIVQASANTTQDISFVLGKVEKQTRFLRDLNELVDANKDMSIPTNSTEKAGPAKADTKTDFEAMYNNLRREFIEEISNHQSFYQSYQNLLLKYKELKNKFASSSSSSDPHKKLKDKIGLIRATTSQPSIRSMCDDILLELGENEILLNSYKLELEAANLKIKQLEDRLK